MGQKWLVKKLPQAIQRPLDASESGGVMVAAVPDGGCCGWVNEGGDQTLLLGGAKVSVLYDELGRYNNRNYGVSFCTADARLAPAKDLLAYTLVSTARAGEGIRVSSEGREDAAELARVRTAVGGLPAVEVVRLTSTPQVATVIPPAALVGWPSGREILVAQDGRLAVYAIDGRQRRETPIRVRSAADAFPR